MSGSNPASWTPPWRNLPWEMRSVLEAARSRLLPPASGDWPRGDGLPVLVIPGFGQGQGSTAAMRRLLKLQDFQALDWGLGRNLGLKKGMTARLLRQLDELAEHFGRPAALLGWSLGGVLARELARKAPDKVCHVISLGSPLAGGHATTIEPLFARLNPGAARAGHDPARYQPPPVPCTAIYSRRDGIVAWQAAMEPTAPNTENIEVAGSHMGLGFNPRVWYAICHRLSPQTAGQAFGWPDHWSARP